MAADTLAAEKFKRLMAHCKKYDAKAYNFLYEALDYTLKNVIDITKRSNRHVSGQELLEGVRRYAIEQFGCLAQTVLNFWGIKSTDDIGEIIFGLIQFDLMGKQDSDTTDDFHAIYDFDVEFDLRPVVTYHPEKREWHTSYIARARKSSSKK